MRKIIGLAAILLASAVSANDQCESASSFLEAAAFARDQGVPEKVSLDVMRQTISKEDQPLYSKLNHLAYTARRGTPAQLRDDFRAVCEQSVTK